MRLELTKFVLIAIFCTPLAAQQINLAPPNQQVKGILLPANGGVGADTSAANGCPKVTAGLWSFSSANCTTGGSAAGGNFAIQYANGVAFAGANFTGVVKNNGSTQPPTAAVYTDIVPLWPSCTGALWSTGVCIDTTNASLIVSGTLADTRLSSNVPLRNATNLFTGQNTFGTSTGTGIQISPGSGSGASISGLVGGVSAWTINAAGLADFGGGVITGGDITVGATPATSGSNVNSNNFNAEGQYFNGVTLGDTWSWKNVLGTGTNPTSALTFSHAGAAGGASVVFPAVKVSTLSIGGSVVATGINGASPILASTTGADTNGAVATWDNFGNVISSTTLLTNIPLKNTTNTFSQPQTLLGGVVVGGSTTKTGTTGTYPLLVSSQGAYTHLDIAVFSVAGADVNLVDSGTKTADLANLNANNTFTGTNIFSGISTLSTIQGPGVPTYTVGAAAQVGTGATLICASGHRCDSNSGTLVLTTGTGSLSSGVIATVTTGITRAQAANCAANITVTTAELSIGTTTTDIILTANGALSASTGYAITYVCMN